MGNSPFGIGWTLSGLAPLSLHIQEKLPHCGGHDGYVFEGDELVPALNSQGEARIDEHNEYWGHSYRSRIEQTFTRLERWTHKTTGRIHWRSRDGAITLVVYGRHPSGHSCIQDHDNPDHTFAWVPERNIRPMETRSLSNMCRRIVTKLISSYLSNSCTYALKHLPSAI